MCIVKTYVSQPLLFNHLTQERTCLSLSLISSRPLDHNTAKIKYADVKVILTKHYHKKFPLLGVTAKGV